MVATAPASEVDICNLALDHLSQKAITSIDSPTTPEEQVMARWYHQVRESLLREYNWNFAQEYATLAVAGSGDFGYEDYYTFPSDFLKLNSIGSDIYDRIEDYQLTGRQIHIDNGAADLVIRYTKNVTDVTTMDPLFIGLFALQLALKTAYKFQLKKSTVEQLNQLLAIETPKAIGVDGQERPPIRVQKSRYLAARRTGGIIGRDNRYYDLT